MAEPPQPQRPKGSLSEVGTVFLKIGLLGFGGPAAHVALMHTEVVERRGWVDERRFLDLFAASNLIPGPTSTELAIFLGYDRGGWPALILAGVLFILPAMAIVLALAWAYVRFGSLPATGWVLYGVTAVVIGIVADALWEMGRTALKGVGWVVLAAIVLGLSLAGISVIALLFGGAIVATLVVNRRGIRWPASGAAAAFLAWIAPADPTGSATAGVPFGMATLFLTFLKIGALLYGGGYVLLAFLRADFVAHLHWLTDKQVVDAVAVGQVTPGPLFTTATFVGYLTGGVGGALLATVAIFLPSFVFVALLYPLLPRVRSSPWANAFLQGATASALGLMAAVTVQLGRAVIVDGITAALAVVPFALLRRYRVNPAWLVLGGAVVGVGAKLIAG